MSIAMVAGPAFNVNQPRGRASIAFPVMAQGSIGRHIMTTLGA
jgi:hypothetical protein